MSVQNEDSELVNVDDEFHMLVTRSNQHKRIWESHQSGVSESWPSIKQGRKTSNCYLKCKEHASTKSDKNWTITESPIEYNSTSKWEIAIVKTSVLFYSGSRSKRISNGFNVALD